MKRNITGKFLLALAALLLLIPAGGAQAAARKYFSSQAADMPMDVYGVAFEAKQKQYGSDYLADIVRTENGVSKTLVRKVDFAYVTNGIYLYYSKPGKKVNTADFGPCYKNTIYRYTIKSGKKQKMASGLRLIPVDAIGKYLYYGQENYADGIDLYSLNIKTKKKNHMVDCVGGMQIGSTRVVTSTNSGDVGNYPIYSFEFDGTKRKKITDGIFLRLRGKTITFAKYKYDVNTHKDYYRLYTCTVTAKKKKAITKWIESIPQEYFQ